MIRAKDLSTLTLIAAPNQLGWLDFRDLFENHHTVLETSKWIKKAKNRKIKRGPIKELLEITFKLTKTDREPPELGAIRMKNKVLGKCSKDELRALVLSLQRLVPQLIYLEGDIISLQSTPEKILFAIQKAVKTNIPPDIADAYLKAFEIKKKKK